MSPGIEDTAGPIAPLVRAEAHPEKPAAGKVIPPTVGRIVWYRPASQHDRETMVIHDNQPLAAIVAYVWSNHMVNLTVSDHNGMAHFRTSVDLVQDGFSLPPGFTGSYCEWMPFQKGQAGKTEAAEAALKAKGA